MCPPDDSHLTIEFEDHFVLSPSIVFYEGTNDFLENQRGERGTPVPRGFEYQSGTNSEFLDIGELRELNERVLSG